MLSKRVDEKTSGGGDYSEIFYFDNDGNAVDSEVADKCVIRECKNNGELVNEIWAYCK
jgi:hypothetical protein